VKIGVAAFPTDYSARPVELARALESRGFESLWVVEHTHIPASRRTPYPPGGDLPSIYWESYEPFTFLAQAAAVTTTIRIGTGICVVPEHHPLALAKRVASLDSLSNGRFLFGVGSGWNAEELENHGVRFEDRWKVLREHVLAMKACWTQKDAEFHGRFVDFDPVWVEPKPVTRPHPPVLIGAQSKWALERVVEFAEGWLPVMSPNFASEVATLRRLCEAHGRDFGSLDISLFGGAADQKALEALATLGVTRVIAMLPTLPLDAALRVLDGYAPLIEWARAI
jgi:probable F420-dependent oxidoreductase